MKDNLKSVKLKYFLLGVLLAIIVMVLTGANQNYLGRFQVSAWSGDGIGFGAFVTDTTTGVTKMVYLNSHNEQRNHLSMPFSAF